MHEELRPHIISDKIESAVRIERRVPRTARSIVHEEAIHLIVGLREKVLDRVAQPHDVGVLEERVAARRDDTVDGRDLEPPVCGTTRRWRVRRLRLDAVDAKESRRSTYRTPHTHIIRTNA